MNTYNALEKQTIHRIILIACVTAFAVAFTVYLPQPADAAHVTPPRVPDDIQVEAGNEAFLVGHAVGTQNYVCLPSDSGVAWTLFTPEATLFDDHDKQIITHFFSPNPDEDNTDPKVVVADGMIRATWRHSKDTSTVWGQVTKTATHSSDPDFVAAGAVAWLLLKAVGVEEGSTGGDTLTDTTFIHRVNTSGGVAPPSGCASSTDVGNQAFVPYTADYFFYKHAGKDADDGK
jgi:hypothetical protein